MRKAFVLLTSLLAVNQSSSEETKTSTKHTLPNTQSNKSQITTTSNTKNARSLQNKPINTKKTKPNNEEDKKVKKSNPNDLKKHVLNKSASELKKLELITDLRRNTSNKSTSSTLRSSTNRRRKSPIKNGDDGNDVESDENADYNNEDDDEIPLGLHLRSASAKYQPSTSQRSESYDEEVRVRNTPGMLLHHNRSMTPDYPSRRRLSQHSPVATTPPLIHNNSNELLKGPRPHYIRERKISSSASSSSSASVDSNGSRYYRDGNTRRSITSNRRYSTYALPYWNEYDDDEYINYNHNQYYDDELYDGIVHAPSTPTLPPIERVRRISLNTSPSRQRKDSFPKSSPTIRTGDSNCLVAGANPPPPNRYRKDSGRKLSMTEYHKYQQEMVNAQYMKHGINPVIDDSIPVNFENPSRTGPTLMQVQEEYLKTNLTLSGNVNASSIRSKRLSMTDRSYTPPPGNPRKFSHSGEINGFDDNIQPRSTKPPHLQQFHHSATSLSSSSGSTYISSSGSGGPPTPTSRRSSMMFGSNVNITNGSRPSTPIGNGYIPEKEKRRQSILREYT